MEIIHSEYWIKLLIVSWLLLLLIIEYRSLGRQYLMAINSNNRIVKNIFFGIIVRQYTGIMQFFIIIFFHQFYQKSITLGYICLSYGLGLWCSKLLTKYLFARFEVIKIMQNSLMILFILNITLFSLLSNFHPLLIVVICMFAIGMVISILHSSINIYSFSLANKNDVVSVSSLVSMVMYISGASSIAIFSMLITFMNVINITGENQYLIAEFILSVVLIYAFAIIYFKKNLGRNQSDLHLKI